MRPVAEPGGAGGAQAPYHLGFHGSPPTNFVEEEEGENFEEEEERMRGGRRKKERRAPRALDPGSAAARSMEEYQIMLTIAIRFLEVVLMHFPFLINHCASQFNIRLL